MIKTKIHFFLNKINNLYLFFHWSFFEYLNWSKSFFTFILSIGAYKMNIRLMDTQVHWYASGFGKADFGGPFCFVRYRVTSQWGARIYRTNINKQSGYLTIKKQIYYTKIDVTTLLAIFPRTILKSFSLFSNKDYGDISPVWFHMVWFQSYWLT